MIADIRREGCVTALFLNEAVVCEDEKDIAVREVILHHGSTEIYMRLREGLRDTSTHTSSGS